MRFGVVPVPEGRGLHHHGPSGPRAAVDELRVSEQVKSARSRAGIRRSSPNEDERPGRQPVFHYAVVCHSPPVEGGDAREVGAPLPPENRGRSLVDGVGQCPRDLGVLYRLCPDVWDPADVG